MDERMNKNDCGSGESSDKSVKIIQRVLWHFGWSSDGKCYHPLEVLSDLCQQFHIFSVLLKKKDLSGPGPLHFITLPILSQFKCCTRLALAVQIITWTICLDISLSWSFKWHYYLYAYDLICLKTNQKLTWSLNTAPYHKVPSAIKMPKEFPEICEISFPLHPCQDNWY